MGHPVIKVKDSIIIIFLFEIQDCINFGVGGG